MNSKGDKHDGADIDFTKPRSRQRRKPSDLDSTNKIEIDKEDDNEEMEGDDHVNFGKNKNDVVNVNNLKSVAAHRPYNTRSSNKIKTSTTTTTATEATSNKTPRKTKAAAEKVNEEHNNTNSDDDSDDEESTIDDGNEFQYASRPLIEKNKKLVAQWAKSPYSIFGSKDDGKLVECKKCKAHVVKNKEKGLCCGEKAQWILPDSQNLPISTEYMTIISNPVVQAFSHVLNRSLSPAVVVTQPSKAEGGRGLAKPKFDKKSSIDFL